MTDKIRTGEAARILQVTTQSVRDFIMQGKLPHPIKVHARLWLLDKAAVLALRDSRGATKAADDNTNPQGAPPEEKPNQEPPAAPAGKWSR